MHFKKGREYMNNRVYGVLGISSVMANWNADFTGYPQTTTGGEIFGSDKAYKYPMKKMWEEMGEKVLYIKSYEIKEGELKLLTLQERYEQIFDTKLVIDQEKGSKKKSKNQEEKIDKEKILKNLFMAVDVKNFGATFAPAKKINLSITGAVQIGQGFNKYADSQVQELDILSPFKNPSKEDAQQSSLGTKIISDEAHYFYPFVINPNAYNDYVNLGVTEGYTQKDYQLFKKAALTAATSFATNAKMGCENEFGLFIETEKDLYLPNLDRYIQFKKNAAGDNNEKNLIELTYNTLFREVMDRIYSVEVYYNPETTRVKMDLDKVQYFDIFTMKEI